MATARQVIQSLVTNIQTVTTGLTYNSTPVAVNIGAGWPSLNTLQDLSKNINNALIAVWDTHTQQNTTRWPITRISNTVPVPFLTATASNSVLKPGTPVTFTFGTPILQNDCFSLSATYPGVGNTGAVNGSTLTLTAAYTATGTDNIATLIQGVAAAVNTAFSGINVVATYTSTTLTLTSTYTSPIKLGYNVNNLGTRFVEYKRTARQLVIICWTNNEPIRQIVTDPIDSYLAVTAATFGYQLSNGEYIRLMYDEDHLSDRDHHRDTFRRDFLVTAEYGTVPTEQVYPISATNFTYTLGTGQIPS